MIKAIGFRKIFTLILLMALCGFIYHYNTTVLENRVLSSNNELSTVQGEISTLQSELDQMKTDAEFFETRRAVYEKISALGFFKTQDRVQARQRFDAIQKLSKIVSARYEIRSANLMTALDTGTSAKNSDDDVVNVTPDNFSMIESQVVITLSAIDDIDIYRFIYFLNYGFPGHITITSISMKKDAEVTPGILKNIGLGNPPSLVSATIDLTWRSMIPKAEMDSSNDLKTLSTGVSQ